MCAVAGQAERRGKIEIETEQRQANRTEGHQPDFHLLAGQSLAQQGAGTDAERKGGEQYRDHQFPAAEDIAGVRRELREKERAVQPEPGNPEDGEKYGALLAGKGEIAPGFTERVEVHPQLRHRRWRHRNAPAGEVTRERHHKTAGGDPGGIRDRTGEQAAGQGADQDGHERTGFNQRIAADQFISVQMLRQDGVFDRPEQGRMQPEQEQRRQQRRQTGEEKAGSGNPHDEHFQHFHQTGQHCFVVLVRQLSGGGGKQEEGQDENSRRQIGEQFRRQRRPLCSVKSEQHDQRVLEHVVVEGAEKLRGEKRGEPFVLEKGKLTAHGCYGFQKSDPVTAAPGRVSVGKGGGSISRCVQKSGGYRTPLRRRNGLARTAGVSARN